MQRRKFLNFTLGALALAVVPASVRAENFRETKPTVWTAHTVDDAIKAMFGSSETIKDGVKVKTQDVASNGGAIPIEFSTKIPAKTVALFQDANPEAAVCAYSVGKNDITNYSVKIKMAKSGTVTVVVEGLDGKLYSGSKTLEVALGGCEG